MEHFFQESCLELFKFTTKVNCDAVWLRLNALWNNSQELNAPSSLCLNIRVSINHFCLLRVYKQLFYRCQCFHKTLPNTRKMFSIFLDSVNLFVRINTDSYFFHTNISL